MAKGWSTKLIATALTLVLFSVSLVQINPPTVHAASAECDINGNSAARVISSATATLKTNFTTSDKLISSDTLSSDALQKDQLRSQVTSENTQLSNLYNALITYAQNSCPQAAFDQGVADYNSYASRYQDIKNFVASHQDTMGADFKVQDLAVTNIPTGSYATFQKNSTETQCLSLLTQSQTNIQEAEDVLQEVQVTLAGKSSIPGSPNAPSPSELTALGTRLDTGKAKFDQAVTFLQSAQKLGCDQGSTAAVYKAVHDSLLETGSRQQTVTTTYGITANSWAAATQAVAEKFLPGTGSSCGCDATNNGSVQTTSVAYLINSTMCATLCVISAALGGLACFLVQNIVDPLFADNGKKTCDTGNIDSKTSGAAPATTSAASSPAATSSSQPSASTTPQPSQTIDVNTDNPFSDTSA